MERLPQEKIQNPLKRIMYFNENTETKIITKNFR